MSDDLIEKLLIFVDELDPQAVSLKVRSITEIVKDFRALVAQERSRPTRELWRCEGCGEQFDEERYSHSRSQDDGHGNPVEVECGPISRVAEPTRESALRDALAPFAAEADRRPWIESILGRNIGGSSLSNRDLFEARAAFATPAAPRNQSEAIAKGGEAPWLRKIKDCPRCDLCQTHFEAVSKATDQLAKVTSAPAPTDGLREALVEARAVIMGWNGMGHEGAELEMVTRAYEQSPEIKRIDAALKAGGT